MSKINILTTILLALFVFGRFDTLNAQIQPKPTLLDKANPWTQKQLMQPGQLTAVLQNPKAKKPVIFNIGVVENIKGAQAMGAARDDANVAKLKMALAKLPKNTSIVLYCGCCPFDKCPNIRPAMKLLNDMKFQNAYLLNLPTSLKADWISKGYPMAE